MKKTNTKNNLEKITAQMIARMEQGTNPWIKPWRLLGSHANGKSVKYFAFNYITNKAYSRANQYGLLPGYYMTFKQVKDLGGNIKKNAKASWVMYTSNTRKKATQEEITFALESLQKQNKVFELEKYFYISPLGHFYFTSEDAAVIVRFIAKAYNVFHIDDCENYRPITRRDESVSVDDVDFGHDDIDAIIMRYVGREKIVFINNKPSDEAYFSPSQDLINLPMKSQYKCIEEYYSTAFHELTHSTGTQARLNRGVDTQIAPFGSLAYSREELVAEMGACFAIGYLGIDSEKTTRNSAAYLKGWASKLRGELKDKIIIASNQAAKAFEFIFELADVEEDINIKDKDNVEAAPVMSAKEATKLTEIIAKLNDPMVGAGMIIDFVTDYSEIFKQELAKIVDFTIETYGLSWTRKAENTPPQKKTLAELKRDLVVGVKLVMLHNYVTNKNDRFLNVGREIGKVQTNGVYLNTPDETGKIRNSWVPFPKADHVEYIDDTVTFYCTYEGKKFKTLVYKIEKGAAA
ncbi:MAG: zincin-like metallopeptidase domain-containing protein [Bacteroidales bacterium]|nr:zincin-like metallopeptidase domain-containing protein [Acholeplasmataceae bacterium]MCK9449446.1 zincin-like metallopeptidase domain-containing protein [Bacteroidales bacterium]